MKALIVDDVNTDRLNLKQICEGLGHTTTLASSAEEAKELLKTLRPDVIFLDIILGDSNGFELCREIKRSKLSDAPVVFISSKSGKADQQWGITQGAMGHIGKPATSEAIAAVLSLIKKAA